jgi:hypothetical protein
MADQALDFAVVKSLLDVGASQILILVDLGRRQRHLNKLANDGPIELYSLSRDEVVRFQAYA